MITGVWLSPDRSQLAVQLDEEEIVQMSADWGGTISLAAVPVSWQTLLDTTDTEGIPS